MHLSMNIIAVKCNGQKFRIGDLVSYDVIFKEADYGIYHVDPQRITGFAYIPRDKVINASFKSWPTSLSVDRLIKIEPWTLEAIGFSLKNKELFTVEPLGDISLLRESCNPFEFFEVISKIRS